MEFDRYNCCSSYYLHSVAREQGGMVCPVNYLIYFFFSAHPLPIFMKCVYKNDSVVILRAVHIFC